VPDVIICNAAISACEKGPAVTAGRTFLPAPAGSAALRHRAGDDHQQRSISACDEGLLLRALRRHDIVPKVITYNAAIRVRKGAASPAGFVAYERCSAMPAGRRWASSISWLVISYERCIVPNVITYNAAIRVRKGPAASAGRTSFTKMWRHDVVPNVITYNAAIRVRKGLAAPAGLSSLTSGSAPRHRAGGDHQQRSISACEKSRLHQQAWHLVRMMCRHGIVPNVITCNAAIRTRTGAAAPAGFHPLRAVQQMPAL